MIILLKTVYIKGKEMNKTDKRIYEFIEENLSKKRFSHSLNVATTAKKLAKIHKSDQGAAFTAGLAHDMLKEAPQDFLLQLVRKSGILPLYVAKREGAVLHSFAASQFLKDEGFGVSKDILNAVAYHCTGRAGMSLLEKIVYVADYTSEDRTFKAADKAREMSVKSIDKTMAVVLKSSLKELLKSKSTICPLTIDAYNENIIFLGDV